MDFEITLFPISLVLGVLTAFLKFLLGIGTALLYLIMLFCIFGAIASFIQGEVGTGISGLIIGFLFSPYGLPMIGAIVIAFREDSNFPLVSSIEIIDEEDNFKAKGDIISKRTITKARGIDHVDTSIEALVLSVSQKGYVDFDYMQGLTDKERSIIISELRGEIFLNIREENTKFNQKLSFDLEDGDLPFSCSDESNSFKYAYVTKDEYLSGNISEKIGMPSEEQKEILKGLSERADKVRNKEVEPEEDNMLKITNDGKKLALDQRIINPLLPDNPESKVNVCVKNIFSIWDKTKEDRSTQLLFSDMSTPKGDVSFNIYDDIRDKLVAMGVPKPLR